MEKDVQRHTFHVHGMHCNACVLLTESVLEEIPGVRGAKAYLERLQVEVTGDFGEREAEHIARELSAALTPHGYSLSAEKRAHAVAWKDFGVAPPAALRPLPP